ncbi:MAG: nitrate ABC transporter ATP-binding protein [Candidatus Rokubacteria bacterium RIFCSPLOWO2_02_FULL_68_19]|nr:MAG: nitrate ABC transporter ATP-binding protein [Candidatus Rokubacteria bacterium RIFCSPLOWO2_02_FULL_68_19]OGL18531.1 MAG: nitrate ABC transporter ATP-binding protein [Candidatus Rokubacteria bacterium RIFCSPLOWO2_12_FULL_69_21]
MSRPILEINDVALEYASSNGPITALERVTLGIEEGDFVCVVGPSGCGKTTLLRIIAGFIPPSAGSVRLDDAEIAGPDYQRGVVFQQPALFPWLTVQENVEFGPKMRRLPAPRRGELAESYLRLVRLWDFRAKPPYELSGGMQQRVAIARVLVNDPRILLMDEPFGALDALTREHLQEELLKIWKATGKTVFFITHSVEEACYLGTRVLVMSPRPGRVLAAIEAPFSRQAGNGSSRAVKSSPEFVALREQVLTYIWEEEP